MSLRDIFRDGQPPVDPNDKISEHEHQALHRLAAKVIEWKMAVPAIMFLESIKPLNWIGSQAMVFFEPFVHAMFSFKDYDVLQKTLEKRESVEVLIQKIEKLDADAYEKEQALKKERKKAKRGFWARFKRKKDKNA